MPTEKPAYKPGMKVVITETDELKDDRPYLGMGFTMPVSNPLIKNQILTLRKRTNHQNTNCWRVEENGEFYNEAWFKPYTEKENKDMSETTKYELVKELTGKSIAATACSGEFDKFVKRCGYHTSVVWDLEFEKYAMEQNGWITFLDKRGFLVEREVEIKYNWKKIYVFDFINLTAINIIKETSVGKFSAFSLLDSSVSGLETDQPFKYFVDMAKNHRGYKLEVFNSLIEMMKHYHIDGL